MGAKGDYYASAKKYIVWGDVYAANLPGRIVDREKAHGHFLIHAAGFLFRNQTSVGAAALSHGRSDQRMTSVFWVSCRRSAVPTGCHDKSLLSNYAHYYEAASFLPQQRDKEEVERFARIVAPGGKNLAILDVGCAEGELSVLLARQGHRVTAADISPSFLDQPKSARPKTASGFRSAS